MRSEKSNNILESQGVQDPETSGITRLAVKGSDECPCPDSSEHVFIIEQKVRESHSDLILVLIRQIAQGAFVCSLGEENKRKAESPS